MKLDKILVGLDGSPRQAGVLETAADLATRYGAQLILLRAIGVPPEIPVEAWQTPDMALASFLEGKAREGLESARLTLPEALRECARLETLLATPWQGVCMAAEECEVDLIVIGSHGYSGLDRLLGTTASRVVNHACRPVLVVRPLPLADGSGKRKWQP